MRVDPRIEVQTIPSIEWRGLFVAHGQVCPVRGAVVTLYTALSYDGDAWYTNIAGENAQTPVDIESRCMGHVPLGYGYGRWTVLADSVCGRNWTHMPVSVWIDMWRLSSPPGIGDLPVPVLYRPASDGSHELYDVAADKVRKFDVLDVPVLTDPEADAEKAGGQSVLKAWRREWRKVAGKAFIGFVSLRTDTCRHTSQVPVLYSCKWDGVEFANGLVKTSHLLAEYA